ncbi:elongation factor P maturation arginine rhamnosyltransferase EarP [Comamonas sp. lk]|uniref:elongation factor P maturation arginine rhamnosyltransferase EarP n=1 Tax=Comamonas sp. lk TaxID=2201272 RepID=UPI000EB1D9B7|nr:elongation factor P maturation arginine rhamnosyltransferase EarP [Comamonas sp. lk]
MLDFLPLTATTATHQHPRLTWDIFCQVIDNFGDVGVCWRTAAELVQRGQSVRLWMDDASALQWMAPQPYPQGLSVHGWPTLREQIPADIGDVVIEAFGCEIPPVMLEAIAQSHAKPRTGSKPPVWINLEYLSAEDYVKRCHCLPSRIMSGPAAGLTRWFFYPGFTPATGSVVREQNLGTRQKDFAARRSQWRAAHGVQGHDCAVSLFCYEPAALPQLLDQLGSASALSPQLLVTPGRAAAAVQALPQAEPLKPRYLQPCPQPQFDEMLWACDLNLVRGEDSLVRALWAGQPMIWHIYPQHDNAHHDKLDAFLDWLKAPPSLRAFHHAWNDMTSPQTLPLLTPEMLREWQACVQAARESLATQSDLIAQIQAFSAEKR